MSEPIVIDITTIEQVDRHLIVISPRTALPPNPSAPWDPDPLAVGDRVRVRHGGECTVCAHNRPRWRRYEGATGVVDSTVPPNDDRWRNHRYMVYFDRPTSRKERMHRGTALGAAFARVELERLDR